VSPLVGFHILAGTIAMLSGAAAMAVRKGDRWHVLTGNVFVVSMLCLSASGAFIGFARDQPLNGFMGVLTFYLVSTAWLTASRRDGKTRPIDWAVLMVPLGVAAGLVTYGLEAASSPTGLKGGFSAGGHFVFASVAVLLALGDVRMLLRGGVFGKHRITRHLLRMSLALFIAVGSFFLGQRQVIPAAIRTPLVLYGPVLLVIVFTVYWMVRVRFAKRAAGLYVLRTKRFPDVPLALSE
jgi:uncharacterized membrane protein